MPVGIARPVWGHLITTTPTLVSSLLFSPVSFRHRPDCTSSRGRLVQPIPASLENLRFTRLLQDLRNALLDRLGGFRRDFLGQPPEFPVLCGRGFEVLAAVRDRQLDDLRQRLRARETGEIIERGIGIGVRDLDDLDRKSVV